MRFFLLTFLLFGLNVSAKEIYTCKVNGSTIYQGKPCVGSKELRDKIENARANENAKEAERLRYQAELRERNSRKDPKVGMSSSEARKSSWGEPDDINTTTGSYGTSEQWVYRGTGYAKSRYLNFKNGILVLIQD